METNVERIKLELKNVETQFKGLRDSIDNAEEWNSLAQIITNIKNVGKFLQDVVISVELVCLDALSDVEGIKSEDKRRAAAKYLDEVIKFKGWSKPIELIDEKIFDIVLSITVYFINEKLGHEWNVDKIRTSLEKRTSFIKDLPLIA